ncbi:MAG: hypothetical protein WC511_02510 [Candidatus Pacearchaeota archaeon]
MIRKFSNLAEWFSNPNFIPKPTPEESSKKESTLNFLGAEGNISSMEIQKYSNLEVGRGRPVETIVFNPPITGPSGAKLLSYKWQYKWELAEDDLEGTIEKRVSDWDNPSLNDETGRLIVHEFVVQLPDGATKAVSAETIPILLGLVTKDEKDLVKSVGNTSKSLARLLVEKLKMDTILGKYKADVEKVNQLSFPERISVVYDPEFKFTEFDYSGVKFREQHKVDKRLPELPSPAQQYPLSFFPNDIQEKAKRFWKQEEVRKMGWNSDKIPSQYIQQKLEGRIKKMQKKLELVTKGSAA